MSKMSVKLRSFRSMQKSRLLLGAGAATLLVAGTIVASPLAAQASAPYSIMDCAQPTAGTDFGTKGIPEVRFHPGHFCLVSGDNVYKAEFQTDGNFVIYKGNVAIWSTGTGGKVGSGGFIQLQADDNMVIYNGSSVAVWQSKTAKSPGNGNTLLMQEDGNLVEYKVDSALNFVSAEWQSGTAQ